MGSERFPGERPGWSEGFEYDYSRHVAAYHYAFERAAGLRVLDAGCGEGFGTQILADTAASVTGIDYSDAAIAECRRLWNKPNLRFEQVDLTHPGTRDEAYDLVLNFQVLEHMVDPRPVLEGLRTLMGSTGTLLLTTPNRLRTFSENPYHVHEYTAPELRELLSTVFSSVELFGIHGSATVEAVEASRERSVQRILRLDPLGIRHLLPESVIKFAFGGLSKLVRRQLRSAGSANIVPEDFTVSRDGIDVALDLLAECRV